jgi:hypothetical protein
VWIAVAVIVKPQWIEQGEPAVVQPVARLVPVIKYVAAVELAGAVPERSQEAKIMVTPVDVSVPWPPVAVKVVAPSFVQVTAPAVDDITLTSDATAATRTTSREILLMSNLLD